MDLDSPFSLLFTRYVVVLPDHSWLEIVSWVAQIIIALLAIVAALVAYKQLKEMSVPRTAVAYCQWYPANGIGPSIRFKGPG